MFLRIETLPQKQIVGKNMEMSFANNLTGQLWQSVMPQILKIPNRLNHDLISLQVYPSTFSVKEFNPDETFVKWACTEVESFDSIPDDMVSMIIESGLYAVFRHKGRASEAPKTFGYIYGEWLPNSMYLLDNRPHFEVLGAKYKNDDSESEEEIWIPIKLSTHE